MPEKHPFDHYLHQKIDKLIIGTIPPQRFCIKDGLLCKDDVQFYYGSKDNYFWELIGNIFQVSFTFENNDAAINQRKEFLIKNHIGIIDMVQTCNRKTGSALDKDLEILEFKDVGQVLKSIQENSNQQPILFYTSTFVKSCMNRVFHTYHSIDQKNTRHQWIDINGNRYEVYILYSPSLNALRNMGGEGKDKRLEQYKLLKIRNK